MNNLAKMTIVEGLPDSQIIINGNHYQIQIENVTSSALYKKMRSAGEWAIKLADELFDDKPNKVTIAYE